MFVNMRKKFPWTSSLFCLLILVMNLFLFLLIYLNLLSNMNYIITYFFLIPSTDRRTRARSKLFNTSLASPCVKFYTVLPVSIVGKYFAQWPLSHIKQAEKLYRHYSLKELRNVNSENPVIKLIKRQQSVAEKVH